MKDKFNAQTIIVCIILLVMAILTIVGINMDYISCKVTLGDYSQTASLGLSAEEVSAGEGYGAMSAFAYITLVLAIVNLVVYIVSKLADVKILKWVLRIVSILTIISSIVAIVTAFMYGESGSIGSYSVMYMPAAGCWLLAIGGILSGAVALATSKSKKK